MRAARALAGCAAACCALACAPEVRTYERDRLAIHHFLVGIGNVWAVERTDGAPGLALVDLSTKGDGDAILECLDEIGRKPEDVTLVLLTHGHFDHAGAGAQMQKALDAPVALGAADLDFVQSGDSVPPRSLIIEGELARPFLDTRFPPFTPDILLDGDVRLDDFGIPGQVLSVPGHTAGSVALVLDTGDAFVGDLVRGVDEGSRHDPAGDDGHMGRASTHLYSEDVRADAEHLDRILGLGARTFFPGHGPYFDAASVRGWVTDELGAKNAAAPGSGG